MNNKWIIKNWVKQKDMAQRNKVVKLQYQSPMNLMSVKKCANP